MRYAIRLMGKRPMFTAAIVLTLGTCIGAVTAVFSVVDATLLRPLPFPEPDRLRLLGIRVVQADGRSYRQTGSDGAMWEAFRDSAKTVDFAAYRNVDRDLNFSSAGQVKYITQQRVGAGFFRVFGIPLHIGREFTREEDVPNGPAVVILSHGLWQRAFHGNPSVVGQSATIAGQTYDVIGVASPDFESNADLWTPLRPSRSGEGVGINYAVAGRLRPGITMAQAEAEIASIGEGLTEQRLTGPGVTVRYTLMDLKDVASESLQDPLWMVFAAVILVLLIGCVNIAGMLMAKGAARTSEIATRMALGASRGTVIRQLLSESLALAIAGGLAGIVVGYISLELLKSILPPAFSALGTATLDIRVMSAISIIAILTSVIFGLFPALQSGRVDIRTAQVGRGIAGSRGTFTRRALSTIQIAIAVTMLIGAGLLIRSFNYLWRLDPGFDSTNVITANFPMRDARYAEFAQVNRYYRDVLERLHSLPGVEAAAVTLSLPYERGLNTLIRVPGEVWPAEGGNARLTNLTYTTPKLFEAFRIPLLRGRGITDADVQSSLPIVVINEAFARTHFKDKDPIGAELDFGRDVRQVVGIAGDVLQQAGWGRFGIMGRVPSAYIPVTQFRSDFPVHTAFSPSWVIRATGPQTGLTGQIEEAVKAVDPLLPIASFRSLNQIKLRTLGMPRFMATLLGIAAGLALLLAIIGTYAMISNSVAERTREFGIRLALGASFGQTIRNSAKPGLICAFIGLAMGIGLARMGTRFLQGMLYGVTPVDGVTYAAVSIGVVVVATIASLIPALRITKLDPSQTLRQE